MCMRLLQTISGQSFQDGAHVVLSPSFACSLLELRDKLQHTTRICLSARSTLVIEAPDVAINSLTVDGSLVISAVSDAQVRLEQVTVANRGWCFAELDAAADIPEKYFLFFFSFGL